MMTRGRIAGIRTSRKIAVLPGKLRRISTNAAAVPTIVEMVAVPSATTSERTAAPIQTDELITSSYHRNVKPTGGQLIKPCCVNETSTMKNAGTDRKKSIPDTKVLNAGRPSV